MKALTMKQPWALLIADGAKDVENRTRLVSHRGDIAIHAGAAWDRAAEHDRRVIRAWWGPYGSGPDEVDATFIGPSGWRAVLAVAELHDCHVPSPGCCASEWANPDAGAHWLLRNVRRLETPAPARGALGLWLLPDDVERAVCEQLPAPAVPL